MIILRWELLAVQSLFDLSAFADLVPEIHFKPVTRLVPTCKVTIC